MARRQLFSQMVAMLSLKWIEMGYAPCDILLQKTGWLLWRRKQVLLILLIKT